MAMGAAVSDDYQRGTRKKEEAKAFYSGILCTSKRLSRAKNPGTKPGKQGERGRFAKNQGHDVDPNGHIVTPYTLPDGRQIIGGTITANVGFTA